MIFWLYSIVVQLLHVETSKCDKKGKEIYEQNLQKYIYIYIRIFNRNSFSFLLFVIKQLIIPSYSSFCFLLINNSSQWHHFLLVHRDEIIEHMYTIYTKIPCQISLYYYWYSSSWLSGNTLNPIACYFMACWTSGRRIPMSLRQNSAETDSLFSLLSWRIGFPLLGPLLLMKLALCYQHLTTSCHLTYFRSTD